jgi:hypothetical protein
MRVKGRPHQGANHHEVQDQNHSLANPMGYEALGPSQICPNDQSDAHRDLNRKIQIRTKTGMTTKKTIHSALFLIYAGPRNPNRHRSADVDCCLLMFRRLSGLVASELFSPDVILGNVRFTKHLARAGDHSGRTCYVENWRLKIGKPLREHRFRNVS